MARVASPEQIRAAMATLTPPEDTELDALIALFGDLLKEAQRFDSLGWRGVGGEADKRLIRFDRPRLRNFASYAHGGIGFESGNDFFGKNNRRQVLAPVVNPTTAGIDQARKRTLHLFNETLNQSRALYPDYEEHWRALINETADIGGFYISNRGLNPPLHLSHHSLRVGWRAPLLVKWLGGAPDSILEIGGGHGRFIRDSALLMPETTLYLTDLPFNMIAQIRYLREYFGDAVHTCLFEGDTIDSNARITIVAPWMLDRIPAPVELVANFLSFQHMDATNLDWYGAAIDALKVRRIFHFNRERSLEKHDCGVEDYGFRADFDQVHHLLTQSGRRNAAEDPNDTLTVVLELLERKPRASD